MDSKKKLILFCSSMLVALVFWRIFVLFRAGEVSILRAATGLNIHHYIYGVILILIALLIFIFYNVEKYSIMLAGFGFGSFFDGFISRLSGNTIRTVEIAKYNGALGLTVFLFVVLIMLSICFYLFFKEKV